jgi:hypothetical protein
MSDLVERLRGWPYRITPVDPDDIEAMTREAADEIERLRNMINSPPNASQLSEGKPMDEFSAELTNLITRFLEKGAEPQSLRQVLEEAIEQLDAEPMDDEDEGKPDDDELL